LVYNGSLGSFIYIPDHILLKFKGIIIKKNTEVKKELQEDLVFDPKL
jgi:hypothetical protein